MKMKKHILLFAALFGITTAGFSQSRSFAGKPVYQIVTKKGGNYLGTITVELFPAIAPLAVNNFDSLVNVQFYDSTAFHRVIPGFMIQGGDPNSRHGPISTWGMGDSTQPNVPAEFSAARHLRGTLSAARDTAINSANSQFFICVAPASWLNGNYTVYGRAVGGMDIVDTIVNQPRDANDNPLVKIEMFITYVGSNDTLATVPVLNSPADYSYGSQTNRVLKWDAQSDGIIYHVDVSTDSTFATTYRSVDVGTNQYVVTGLSMNNTYYWRVKSNNGGDTSAYSQMWRFGVSPVGITESTPIASVGVSPNPSHGVFLFSRLPEGSSIEIMDVNGKRVFSGKPNGDSCSVDLSANPKGVYFFHILREGKAEQEGTLIMQ